MKSKPCFEACRAYQTGVLKARKLAKQEQLQEEPEKVTVNK